MSPDCKRFDSPKGCAGIGRKYENQGNICVFHVTVTCVSDRVRSSRRFQWRADRFDPKGKRMAFEIQRVGLAAAICAAGVLFVAAAVQAADDVTSWDGDARSGVRLIAGARPAGGVPLRAGIEIRLARGWHTYWRYPGDSGVPPQFSFEGSRNVKHVDILWPAPERMADAGGTSIGYSVGVIFPLRIVPLEAGKPVALRLKLAYAICEKLCVPADGKGELMLSGGRTSQDTALIAAEARVPKRQGLGEGGELSIRAVRREDSEGKARIVVDVGGPADVDLFVEGPTARWALPVPAPIGGGPSGLKRFAFELDGAPPGESYRGALITLTAVASGRAIEVTTRLD
jgi:DsbC/DsbD-like thiol-disulfide interchange protein